MQWNTINQAVVDKNRIQGIREQGIHHGNKIGAKAKALKHLYNKGPIKPIIGFVKMNLEYKRVLPNLYNKGPIKPIIGFVKMTLEKKESYPISLAHSLASQAKLTVARMNLPWMNVSTPHKQSQKPLFTFKEQGP
jgi:hypothetical protein